MNLPKPSKSKEEWVAEWSKNYRDRFGLKPADPISDEQFQHAIKDLMDSINSLRLDNETDISG